MRFANGRFERILLATATCLLVGATANGQSATSVQPSGAARALHIQQFDVGQGDAALITTPEGRRILIDAGPDADIVKLLRARGVDTLDLVIASHNHADHIGGMPAVFAAFVVRAYLENGVPHTTAIYSRTLGAVEREQGVQYLRATARTITVGSIKLKILPPPAVTAAQNDNPVGVIIEYGGFSALYLGDSETSQLATWLSAGQIPHVTIVKIAHHGSRNGTTDSLVRATSPKIAVVSVGASNGYGHPSVDVVRRWTDAPAIVYRTDRDGTIDVLAREDGTFTVRTEKTRTGQR